MENKVLIIDPNDANTNGLGGIVTPEQLSISVELKAIKKDRSAISISNGKASVKLGSNATPISFLNGSDVGNVDGRPSLTTLYTELGNNLNYANEDLETLGIKDIQIEFNSACAPLIVINFVDVRGKLFEMGKNSPYSVFWELPYPIFELTVKGYYGKAVTYKLHLTKFNGGFDYSTGNFEVQCNFVGYTYAFLSDVIMGHLKGITYTVRGLAKIEEKKKLSQGTHQFFTFRELNEVIKNVSTSVSKIKNDDKGLKAIKKADEIVEQLENFKENILSSMKSLASYRRINDDTVLGFYAYKPNEQSNSIFVSNDSDFDNEVIEYNKSLLEKLKQLNNDSGLDNGYKLTESNFILKNGETIHDDIRKIDFSSNVGYYVESVSASTRYVESLADEVKYDAFKRGVLSVKNTDILTTFGFKVIDLNDGLKEIDSLIRRINLERKEKFMKLGENLVGGDIFFLNDKYFNPSIGNIINLICDHVDILMDCIRDVAVEAEKDTNIRAADLKNIAGVLDEVDGQLGNLKAFPTYSEMEDGVYVDKWIGNVAPDIPEVKFIEDLLEGIIKANQEDVKALSGLEINNQGKPQWFPVNTFDNPIFGVTNVYDKLKDNGKLEEYLRLIVLRCITYFYGNSNLTNEEIKSMAILEANNVYTSIVNTDIKNALRVYSNTGKNSLITDASAGSKFKNYTSGNFGQSASIVKSAIITNKTDTYVTQGWQGTQITNTLNSYVYTYAPAISGSVLNYNTSFLPLSLNGKDEYSLNRLVSGDGEGTPPSNTDRIERRNDGEIFFTNKDSNNIFDDGATTIKILNGRNSVINKVFYPSYGDNRDDVLDYKLKVVNLDDNTLDTGPLNYFFQANGGGFSDAPVGLYFYDNDENFLRPTNVVVNNFKSLYMDNNSRATLSNDTIDNTDTIYTTVMNNTKAKTLRRGLANGIDKLYVPHIGFWSANYIDTYYSLFGSDLYYSQTNNMAKGYLFLHSIPFTELSDGSIFNDKYIKKFFKNKGGFVEIPYSWGLFIGAILGRYENKFTVRYGDSSMSFIRDLRRGEYPTTSQFSVADVTSGWFNFNNDAYEEIDSEILNLPKSAKNEFIKLFEDWVSNEFPSIVEDLEIFVAGTTKTQIRNFWISFNTLMKTNPQAVYSNPILKPNLKKNYAMFLRISDGYEDNETLNDVIADASSGNDGSPFNFLLEIRNDSNAAKKMNQFLTKTRVIASASHRIWTNNLSDYGLYRPITADKVKFETYLDSFFTEYINLSKNLEFSEKAEEKAIRDNIFQTINNDDIKLNLYIKIKSLYDKWICGSDEKYNDLGTNELYDSFRFIDRAYKNIEDDFKVNIIPMVAQLTENYNQSFYNYIARVLGDNNFDFFPLPSFINYNDANEVRDVFKVYSYNKMQTSLKPQFICMYIGEKSNALGESVNFKNNSFNFNDNSLPADFQTGESNVPIFLVQYGAQDQSIFKDLKLTQSEFTATDESLTITDAISKQSNTSTSVGQNLFDVYINRSYTCHVEMLGNAMIQPLMYFQLDNVPMFRGAYTIIKVTHNIKPNTMTTNFTGVRMRFNKTKMIDEAVLVKNLLGDIGDVSSDGADLNDLNAASTGGTIPNTRTVDNLKGQISQTEFNKNKDNKFDKYE